MTRLEVDVTSLAATAAGLGLVAIVLLPLARFILAPWTSPLRVLPGPESKHWFWGSWTKETYVDGSFERRFAETIEQYGPVFSMVSLGRNPTLAISDHKAANRVLFNYARQPRTNGILRRHVGRGLLTEDGATHRRQRKVAQPAFTAKAIFDLAPVFKEKTDQLAARLHSYIDKDTAAGSAEHGTRINIAKDLNCVALDVIGKAGFDYEFNSLTSTDGSTSELEAAFLTCMHTISSGTPYAALRIAFGKPIEMMGRLLKVDEQLQLDKARGLVHGISAELVRRAKKRAAEGDHSARDVLSLMVKANTSKDIKPSQHLADKEIIDQVPVLLVAGHETTSTATSWACYSLIQGERGAELQRRLREELEQPENQGWRDDVHRLDSLPYLDAFTKETLRFHCPVRQMSRSAPYNDVLPLSKPVKLRDGTMTDRVPIRKGEMVFLSVKWLNTDESLWGPDGKEFKPERWLPEDHKYYESGLALDPSVKELKGVYSHLLSFGAGPKQCIGLRLSIMEMKYILSSLVSNFDILPPHLPGEAPVKMMSLTQIVAHPFVEGEREKGLAMPVRIRARAGGAA